jgi:hypothetical protein
MPQRQFEPEAKGLDSEPAPPTPPPRSPVAHVLDLQRTHGNAAVARLLARQPVDAGVPPAAGVPDRSVDDIPPPRPGDKADMDRAILDYMVAGHWANAVQVLNGFSQADIDERVKGYVPESRDGIIGAAATLGKDAERVRAPAQIEKALRSPRKDYYDLTRALAAYPDAARLPLRIGELDGSALAQVLRWAQAGPLPLAGALAPAAPRTPSRSAAWRAPRSPGASTGTRRSCSTRRPTRTSRPGSSRSRRRTCSSSRSRRTTRRSCASWPCSGSSRGRA